MPALPGVGCPALLQARAASPGILCVNDVNLLGELFFGLVAEEMLSY